MGTKGLPRESSKGKITPQDSSLGKTPLVWSFTMQLQVIKVAEGNSKSREQGWPVDADMLVPGAPRPDWAAASRQPSC